MTTIIKFHVQEEYIFQAMLLKFRLNDIPFISCNIEGVFNEKEITITKKHKCKLSDLQLGIIIGNCIEVKNIINMNVTLTNQQQSIIK